MSTGAPPIMDEVYVNHDTEILGPQKMIQEYILKREPAFQMLVELRNKVIPNLRLCVSQTTDIVN
jgi:hypothetical protein